MKTSAVISNLSVQECKYFAEIFQKSLELVQKGWTQGAHARDAGGENVAVSSPKACSYCTIGAAYAGVLGKQETEETPAQTEDKRTMISILKGEPELEFRYIIDWNDATQRKQEDVVQLFKNIVAELKRQ